MLETIPSFSFHHERNWYEEDSDEEDDDKEEEEREQSEEHDGFFENSIATRGSGLNFEKQNMGLNDEMRFLNAHGAVGLEMKTEHNSGMYLTRGLELTVLILVLVVEVNIMEVEVVEILYQ
ncbi:hypothetical protein LOK49_LG13G01011 [Camellia lanceoleosa]|uniref:Uncharacterized protein n=1 Tax=Camellia lanceoleosa TaxID=1840588 RepID=A0ACC0FJ88_9ERIC|nr:hypothetical protein LOK49_LG13G01011 [Camellia lanceoleosa]